MVEDGEFVKISPFGLFLKSGRMECTSPIELTQRRGAIHCEGCEDTVLP